MCADIDIGCHEAVRTGIHTVMSTFYLRNAKLPRENWSNAVERVRTLDQTVSDDVSSSGRKLRLRTGYKNKGERGERMSTLA